jgi:hypothetical protein
MGLPGSGKSTLARALLRHMRQQGILFLSNEEAVVRCIRRRDDGIIRNILKKLPFIVWEPFSGTRHALAELHLFSSEHPALFELLFEILNRRPIPLAWRQCVLYAFYLHAAERQLLEIHLLRHEGCIVEEGMAMGLLAMLGCLPPGTPCREEVRRFVGSVPLPSALFWIDTNPSHCAARLRRRAQMPLPWEKCTDRELMDHLAYGRDCIASAIAEFKGKGVPVCVLQNDDGCSETAERLIRQQGRAWGETLLAS